MPDCILLLNATGKRHKNFYMKPDAE